MQKLFMLLLGATPKGRHIEQHDIFFGIGNSLNELIPDIIAYWPEAEGKVHIDAWREVNMVDGYTIQIVSKNNSSANQFLQQKKLFFLNLGGYKQNEFEEYHYKMIVVCNNKSEAVQQAKQTAFYKHNGFTGAASHVDDKYGLDVDDLYEIADILPARMKEEYAIGITEAKDGKEDELHMGYYQLSRL